MSARSRATWGRAPAVSSILTAMTLWWFGCSPVSGLTAGGLGFGFGLGFGELDVVGVLGVLDVGGGGVETTRAAGVVPPPPLSRAATSTATPAMTSSTAIPAPRCRVREAMTQRAGGDCIGDRTARDCISR